MPGEIQVPWDPLGGALKLTGGAHESFLQEVSDASWPRKRAKEHYRQREQFLQRP